MSTLPVRSAFVMLAHDEVGMVGLDRAGELVRDRR